VPSVISDVFAELSLPVAILNHFSDGFIVPFMASNTSLSLALVLNIRVRVRVTVTVFVKIRVKVRV